MLATPLARRDDFGSPILAVLSPAFKDEAGQFFYLIELGRPSSEKRYIHP
jgi:hypothetical protein